MKRVLTVLILLIAVAGCSANKRRLPGTQFTGGQGTTVNGEISCPVSMIAGTLEYAVDGGLLVLSSDTASEAFNRLSGSADGTIYGIWGFTDGSNMALKFSAGTIELYAQCEVNGQTKLSSVSSPAQISDTHVVIEQSHSAE